MILRVSIPTTIEEWLTDFDMKRFTPEEDQYLRDNYLTQSLNELAKNLNRNMGSIHGRLPKLNLIVPDEIKKNRNKESIQKLQNGAAFRFTKGHKPWNAGMKGLQCGGVETRFKKGNIPHNTKYDGHTRVNVDGYVEQRVSIGVYKLQHRIIWEQHNGPIPEGFNVQFKDGNKLNTNIENLYLASKSQNMEQNTIHRYSPELKKAIRTVKKLTKTIQEYETNEH